MPGPRMKSGARRPSTSSKMKAPPHPFPELQGPFEESMTEMERLEDREVPSDAASRRTILLDAPTYERVIAGRWKQRPGEKYHPLWKIVAQLSFGIHLLAENLAKSEDEVMQILQGHIDEIDLFLERTTEDFALAQDDIRERMRCLQLPLQHPKVFDRMLEDRTFRNSIVEGNEKIEHIVARTGFAMRDSLKDAQKGLDATNALSQYLESLEVSWGRRNVEQEAIFEAMLENVEGWRGAFIDLREQGDKLDQLLKQLTEVINQMQQRAGEVSRRLIRAQQKQGASPTTSNSITYISRQSVSSTDATRSDTPEMPKRKPLPGVPNREPTRLSAQSNQRCQTAQSTRSVASRQSGHLHTSRASSRDGIRSSTQDPGARLSTKSPRLIEIRRPSPTSQEAPRPASKTPSETLRPDRLASQPVELPSDTARTTRRTASISTSNSFNAGLGILHNEAQTQTIQKSYIQNSPAAGSATDASGSAKLPLTPRSMNSIGNSPNSVAHELPSETVPHRVPDTSAIATRPVAESSLGSPPSTPGWAKQTFEMGENDRVVADRTPFRSHPPNAELGSPPILVPNSFKTVAQHARINGSIASSIGAPGPEVASSPVKSKGPNGVSTSGPPVGTSNQPVQPGSNDGKKVFLAELEGTTPTLLQPSTYTREAKHGSPREITQEVLELEVPLLPINAPPASPGGTQPNSSITSLLDVYGEPSKETRDSTSPPKSDTSPAELSALEHKVAAAVRRSFIARNIELPGVPVEDIYINKADVVSSATEVPSVTESEDPSSKSVTDILAQLDQFDTKPLNLSLKGEDLLITLPATTYVADRKPVPAPAPKPATTATATQPQQKSDKSGVNSSSGAAPAGTSRFKLGLTRRDSSESNSSSQSQWRAFFKGQLSPADINSSTPHLPSKVSSTHRTIIDLQRRGQEASPTLGWQWAPESPEVERRSAKRTNV